MPDHLSTRMAAVTAVLRSLAHRNDALANELVVIGQAKSLPEEVASHVVERPREDAAGSERPEYVIPMRIAARYALGLPVEPDEEAMSLRPRPGETAEDTIARVTTAARRDTRWDDDEDDDDGATVEPVRGLDDDPASAKLLRRERR